MSQMIRQALVVARRDFIAVVGTPTFLIFLLAPLFMILMSLLGVTGAAQIADTSQDKSRIAVIAQAADSPYLVAADERLRDLLPEQLRPPKLEIIPSHGTASGEVAAALLIQPDPDFVAILYGPLEKPMILKEDGRRSEYLSMLAEQVLRDRKAGIGPDQRLSKPETSETKVSTSSASNQHVTGYAAVFGIFFLTLLLAGQSVGMLAEEKSNKVIEILAAAAPLESVFLGKLIGMFGVALATVATRPHVRPRPHRPRADAGGLLPGARGRSHHLARAAQGQQPEGRPLFPRRPPPECQGPRGGAGAHSTGACCRCSCSGPSRAAASAPAPPPCASSLPRRQGRTRAPASPRRAPPSRRACVGTTAPRAAGCRCAASSPAR